MFKRSELVFDSCLELPSHSEKYLGFVVDKFSELVPTAKNPASGHLDTTYKYTCSVLMFVTEGDLGMSLEHNLSMHTCLFQFSTRRHFSGSKIQRIFQL